ncbi:hypothetical protein J7L68_09155 [bacterium]|nr:hypothetical protein [bacterium]
MEISDKVLSSIVYEAGKSKGWLKFIGIITIISGALQALTIFGIVIAWLPIWMGILLLQTGKFADAFANEQDPSKLAEMLQKMRLYFTIQGILMLIGLIAVVLTVLAAIVLMILGISIPFIENIGNM